MRLNSSLATPRASLKANLGFALLITLLLLALLVLLLVGLATFTKVETRISDNTAKQAQARQNALMALNIALGQLQKYAGPDARITATSDFFPTATNFHYTGVWDSTTDTATPITWLVSGNENVDLPVVTPANATRAVTLVGTNTVGATLVSDQVTAPLVAIKASGVNGQPDGTVIGNYGWWIGDQGVKAPVALADPTYAAGDFDYSPYKDFPDLLNRVRQQISLGAGAFDLTANAPAFEPRDGDNFEFVANQKIAAFNQLAFLRDPAGVVVGFAALQKKSTLGRPTTRTFWRAPTAP